MVWRAGTQFDHPALVHVVWAARSTASLGRLRGAERHTCVAARQLHRRHSHIFLFHVGRWQHRALSSRATLELRKRKLSNGFPVGKNSRALRHHFSEVPGGKRPVVKVCSPYPRLLSFQVIGVDSCVFFIFTTRVDLNTRLNGVKSIRFEPCRKLVYVFCSKNRINFRANLRNTWETPLASPLSFLVQKAVFWYRIRIFKRPFQHAHPLGQ